MFKSILQHFLKLKIIYQEDLKFKNKSIIDEMKQNNIIFKIDRISSFNISLWRKKNDPELQGRNILSWDNKISTINNLNKIALKITKRWKKKKKKKEAFT